MCQPFGSEFGDGYCDEVRGQKLEWSWVGIEVRLDFEMGLRWGLRWGGMGVGMELDGKNQWRTAS